MKIIVAKNYREMSERAADLIFAEVLLKPDCVLGLATGSSPLGVYASLSTRYAEGRIQFHDVTTINLDEYQGIDGNHEQSYRYYMNQNLFQHIDIQEKNIYIPDGLARDPHKECLRYDQIIHEKGRIDLQLLGLGMDGHIGFNEPADSFTTGTHLVKLDPSTVDANSRFFKRKEDVPRYAYTVGIDTIMQARKVVMLVCGAAKAEIVQRAFEGPVVPQVPASILQLHPDFTLVMDQEASSMLMHSGHLL